jgi:hypothetical protein
VGAAVDSSTICLVLANDPNRASVKPRNKERTKALEAGHAAQDEADREGDYTQRDPLIE